MMVAIQKYIIKRNTEVYLEAKNVKTAVDDFVGEAEQFDDLTMMCIKYNG
ncbi:MAG: hypothetical protein K5865_02780 [Eubacterium sp.]|nr:hypothetical protein [Eubacterium sp.]